MPWMVTVIPLPLGSLMFHARRTVWLAPIVTAFGEAVKLLITGGGHAFTVTVVCAVACAPHPAVAVSVYVVVVCGWAMSMNPLGPNVPTPAITAVTPVPDGSLTDHDKRTVPLLPAITEDGAEVNEFMTGGGQAFAVTVVVAVDWAPHPARAVSVYVVEACGCAISTNPVVVVQEPTPAIEMVTPVPELSVTSHDRRTVAWFPTVTEDGAAVKEFIVGCGHAPTVTVAAAMLCEPHPDLANN